MILCFFINIILLFFFFNRKTAYDMRISDWSSDVCSSDLTILMASCIFYECLLGNKVEKDARYCHNALVFAPDKTVLHSLKEIESFDLTRVVPPEYVNFLTTHLRFHYLEEAGTSLDTLDRSRFNIIVSNTQKIILKRQHKEKTSVDKLFGATGETLSATGVYADAADLYNFNQQAAEGELTTNQRFEKLRRLEQLGIYVNEEIERAPLRGRVCHSGKRMEV